MEKKIPQASISWEAANVLVVAGVKKAEQMGVQVNICVVGRGGHLVAFLGMPGAAFHAIDVAMDKAYTAVSFGFPTSQWADIIPSFSEEVRVALPNRPRLAMFGGGVPVEVDGELIGAIGVSGASEEQDGEIAEAALAAL